jgi:hypothetical protein
MGRALAGAVILAAVACTHATVEDRGSTSQAVAPANPTWGGWVSLSGGLATDPAAVAYDANHVGAFATNYDLYFDWFKIVSWGGWVDLGNNGNPLSAPPVAVVAGNHVEVFVEDTTAGRLLHKEGTFNGGNTPTWSGWESIWLLENAPGGSLAATGPLASLSRPPAVVVTQPGNQVNVIANFADGSTKVTSMVAFGNWRLWTNLGGVSHYEPGAVSWGPDRLDVFVVGTDAAVYHQYSNDNATTFYPAGGNWERVGGNAASAPSVVSWGPNRLDVFVSGRPSGQITGVQHLAWTGGSWGTCGAPPCWDSLHMLVWQNGVNGPMPPPVAVTTGVGAINVFAQGIDEGLETMAMTASNPPAWGNYQELAPCFRTGGTPAVISPDNNSFDVIVTGYAANNDAALFAESSVGGADFAITGTTALPACSCGAPGSTCCWPSNGCSDGAACGTNNLCTCQAGYVQQTGSGEQVCVHTGNTGEQCSAGNKCNTSTDTCYQGTCTPAGNPGAPCYTSGTCLAGAPPIVCVGGVGGHCEWCGAANDYCCEDPFVQCGDGLVCTNDKCVTPTAPCGATGETCCASGTQCTGSGATCSGGLCEVPPPPCSTQGSACCSGKCAASSGLECKSNKCVAPPSPPPDPAGCGQIGAPAYPCCHNRKNACDLNGVCDSYGNCEPASSGSSCSGNAPVAVSICVTTDNSSEVYSGEWCSAQAATSFYTTWCTGLKTEHGYTTCTVGAPNAPTCP